VRHYLTRLRGDAQEPWMQRRRVKNRRAAMLRRMVRL
jgi:hypothetical protein